MDTETSETLSTELCAEENTDVLNLLAGPRIDVGCQSVWIKPWVNRGGISVTTKTDGINLLCCDDEVVLHELVDVLCGHKRCYGVLEAVVTQENNRYVIDTGAAQFLRKVTAIFDANDGLIGTMTPRQLCNLQSELLLHNLEAETRNSFVNQICARLGLAPYMDNIIGDPSTKGLSTGQRRRLSFALTLLKRPRIIFMHNPLIGLDGMTAANLRDFVKDELCEQYNINIVWCVNDIYSGVWSPTQYVTIVVKWSTFVAGEKAAIEQVIICSELPPIRSLWVSEHDRLRVQSVYLDGILYRQMGIIHTQTICDVVNKMVQVSAQSWVGMPSIEDDKEYSIQHSFYHDDMKLAFMKSMPPMNQETLTHITVHGGHPLIEKCICGGQQNPLECFRCYYEHSFGGTSTTRASLVYSLKVNILSKVKPYRAYFGMIFGLLTLNIVLGCIFYRIPTRITNNRLNTTIITSDVTIPPIFQELIALIFYGVQGSSQHMGPRPLLEMLANGVRGDHKMRLLNFLDNKDTVCTMRKIIRCLGDKFPLDDPYFHYPNRNLCKSAYSYTSNEPDNECIFTEDCYSADWVDILHPTPVMMDVITILQIMHFISYNIDFDKYFPGFLGEGGAWESDSQGLPYWSAVLNKGKGFHDQLFVCMSVPALPCISLRPSDCNDWPDDFTEGKSNSLVSKLDLQKYITYADKLLREAEYVYNYITRSPALKEDEEITDYWNNYFRQIIPTKYTFPQVIGAVLTPQVEDDDWSFIASSLVDFLDLTIDVTSSDGHSSFITLLNRIQAIVFDVMDLVWQAVNTTGCVFAITAAMPFFTMETLFRRSRDMARYRFELKHGYYNSLIYGLAQMVADVILSVIPLTIVTTIWLALAGFFTFEGSWILPFILFTLAFGAQSLCSLVSQVFALTEVALIIAACIFIVMLLFSGFVVRTESQHSWMKFFEAFSLHRWSYFSVMQTILPPSCKIPDLYDNRDIPMYGIIPYELMLTLSGVSTDCNYYGLFLFLLGVLFRVSALVLMFLMEL